MRKLRSLLTLLLALAMALSLAACGDENEEEEKPENAPPSMAYKAEYIELDMEGLQDGIRPVVYTDEGFYGLNYGKIGEREIPEGVVPEYEGEYDLYGYRIYFVTNDGSLREMENYEPLPVLENTEGKLEFYSGVNLLTLLDDGEGGLIAVEGLYTGWFDGTEAELNRGGDSMWEKYRYNTEYYLRFLNADGSEKKSVKIDFDATDTWLNFENAVLLEDNKLLVIGDQALLVFDSEGSLLYQITCDNYVERPVKMNDGSVVVVSYDEKGMCLLPVDTEKKSFGEPIQMPNEAYNLQAGDEEYDFYYVNGMYLYGYKLDTQEQTRVFNWLDLDVNGSNIQGLHFFPDGHMVGVINQWKDEQTYTEVITVKQVPAEALPQKETLTLAVLYADDVLDKVVDFNRHNDSFRIEIRDYSEYNDYENEDYEAGYNKLMTEIMSGEMPDILAVGQLPYSQLAAKGLLEDLYPYIDADPDMNREDFFPNLLQALEVDGGLYQITPSFNVQTLVGASSVVGTKPGWTYADLQAALSKMPAGCSPMDMYTTRGDMLRTLLAADLDHYVDWGKGVCNFESQDFIELLEFTAQFPASIPENMDWESTESRIAQGRQMLTAAYLYNVEALMWNDASFGAQGCTYIGYPTNNGVGSFMVLDSGFAISASCKNKDAAWQFLRSFVTEEGQENVWGIPARLDAYQKQLDKAMEIEYEKDSEGNYRLDAKGERIPVSRGGFVTEDGREVYIYSMTQEQADKLWEAVTSCNKLFTYDEEIFDLVAQQAEAYYVGDKSAEEVSRLIQSKMTIYVNERR